MMVDAYLLRRGDPIPTTQLATERVVISQPRRQEEHLFQALVIKKSSTKPDQY
jgi:hypothetical protein